MLLRSYNPAPVWAMTHEAELLVSDSVEEEIDASSYRIELSDGRSFRCRSDETILCAALRAGLNAPYECASGACGSCKCRVKRGVSTMLWEAAPGLSDRDRAKSDRILACQAQPRSDMVLTLRADGELHAPAPERWLATVENCITLNATVMRIVLRIPAAVQFLPGQFCLFEIPGAGRRAYSMANLPNGEGRLEFLIKRKPGGSATGFLMKRLGDGATLCIEGPYGRGHLRRSSRPIVAVAGGSGLAPMLSILRGALQSGCAERADLYFGVNSAQDLFYLDELAEVAAGRARPSGVAGHSHGRDRRLVLFNGNGRRRGRGKGDRASGQGPLSRRSLADGRRSDNANCWGRANSGGSRIL